MVAVTSSGHGETGEVVVVNDGAWAWHSGAIGEAAAVNRAGPDREIHRKLGGGSYLQP